MGFATDNTPEENYEAGKQLYKQVLARCNTAVNQMSTVGVRLEQIMQVNNTLQSLADQIEAIIADPGLAAYAASRPNGNANVVADAQATVAAIRDYGTFINTNMSNFDAYTAIVAGAKVTFTETVFPSGVTTGLQTRLQNIINA